METQDLLYGACACGRNQYEISLVESSSAQVLFDNSRDGQRAHGTLLPALLRIPLASLRSSTYALYPNETHSDIRRAFTPRFAPYTKRHFCGYCGTPLSTWSEADRSEAEWVCVNLGSMTGRSLGALIDLGVLPSADDEAGEETEEKQATKEPGVTGVVDVSQDNGAEGMALGGPGPNDVTMGKPWAEEIVEGSALGRLRRRRGGNASTDGSVKVEWEILEYDSGSIGSSGESAGNGKRKLVEVADDDVMMGGRP